MADKKTATTKATKKAASQKPTASSTGKTARTKKATSTLEVSKKTLDEISSKSKARSGGKKPVAGKKSAHLSGVGKSKSVPEKPKSIFRRVTLALTSPFRKLARKNRDFRSRRPHRSFRMTRRRDYRRSLKMPGYIAFTNYVWKTIWKNKKLFFFFLILYGIFSAVILGVLSQENYTSLRDTFNSAGEDLGISKILGLAAGAITGGGSSSTDSGQQILSVFIFLFGWLVIVWSLRHILAGHKIKLRDGLYSAGSPILSTLIIVLVIALQLLPFALAMLAYSALSGVGIIGSGIESMALWAALALIGALTLYWLVSSFFALIVVTLPGMYPFRALKAAGDLVVGRRLRIMFRIIWMAIPLVLMWGLILVPAILIDDALHVAWLPLVPFATLILSTLTLIWAASYIYLLYRKVVDDDAKPA